MSSSTTACPNHVNCDHVSRTTRPVTQVALVAVNMALSTSSRPCLLAMGKVSSSVPSAITIIKLTQMIWVGVLSPSFLRRTDLWCRSFLRIFFIFSIASSLRSTQPLCIPL